MAYTDEQIAQAITESVAQGFTVDQAIQGATQNYGVPADQAMRAAVSSLYEQQLGRTADPEGLAYWAGSGLTPAQIATQMAQSLEGQNYLTQAITSAYRQDLGRNPEQSGYQYWQSAALNQGLTADQLASIIRSAAVAEQAQRGITGGFTDMELAALEADPYGGRYATKSIYDLLPDAVNVSYINGVPVQFVSPVTQQMVQSIYNNRGAATTNTFTDAQVASYIKEQQVTSPERLNDTLTMFNVSPEQAARAVQLIANKDPSVDQATAAYNAAIAANPALATQNQLDIAKSTGWSASQGLDVLNTPAAQAAISRALASGTMTQSDYNVLLKDLSTAKNATDMYAAFNKPQGQVVIDAIYGQQIGEGKTLAEAQAEAAQRQAVLDATDKGYYQNNMQLADAYKAAGLEYPFGQSAYTGYDTRVDQSNVLTQQNFNQQINKLLGSLNKQFGTANNLQTPLTGQYYSETGLQPGYTPVGTEGTTFRSGVAGYVPQAQLPTRFDFGAVPVNATFQQYRPGAFQPAGVTTGGFITGYNADGTPIYSTYANPNQNVGGVTSALNPYDTQANFEKMLAAATAKIAAETP